MNNKRTKRTLINYLRRLVNTVTFAYKGKSLISLVSTKSYLNL